MCILVCPYGWNKGEIFSLTLFMENFKNYMVIRLGKSTLSHYMQRLLRSERTSDARAEFETIHIGKLCHNAHRLAEIIFKSSATTFPNSNLNHPGHIS